MKNNLTIVAVDTAYHQLTKAAIDQTLKVTDAKELLVFSDRDFYPGSKFVKIKPINQIEYSHVILKDIVSYIDTEFYMCIQYDGMPVDPDLWDDDYLKYDYIGAPWNWGPTNRRVGNGGFSIRSKKLGLLCQNHEIIFNPPGHGDNNYMEDVHICVMYADYLEKRGIKYAPVSLAKKFSAETPGGKFNTYGFHGTLCLPYYLDNDHMAFYIDNMAEKQFTNPTQIRIIFGLYLAERWDMLEYMMDKAVSINPNFKNLLFNQFKFDINFFPTLNLEELKTALINY